MISDASEHAAGAGAGFLAVLTRDGTAVSRPPGVASDDFAALRLRFGPQSRLYALPAGFVVVAGASREASGEGDLHFQWDAPASSGGVGSGIALRATADGLVIERGFLGARAVYVAETVHGVVASTHFDVVRALLGPAGTVVDGWVTEAALLLPQRPEQTPLREIVRVPSGATVTLRQGGWSTAGALPVLRECALTPELAADAIWDALRAAVRRQIAGRGRIGILLSGGLDSSGILAAFVAEARGASAKEISAFTWDFAGSDDRRYVDALADAFGIAPLRMAPAQAPPFAEPALLPRGLPYGLVSGPMDAAANAIAAAAGVDALLTGAGGDEILTGPLQAMALAFPAHPWRTLAHATRLQLPWDTSRRSRISDFILRPLLRPLLPSRLRERAWLRREEAWVSWAGPEARRHRAAVATIQATRRTLPRSPEERLQRLTDLTAWDRFGDLRTQLEAQGGAVRIDPLLDAEFVQLLVSLPPMLLQDGALHRGLWRRVLRGRVPALVSERRTKNSFEVAFGEAHPFDSPWFQAFIDVPRELVARGVVDPAAWIPYRDAVRHAPTVAARGAALGFIYDACLVERFLTEERRR